MITITSACNVNPVLIDRFIESEYRFYITTDRFNKLPSTPHLINIEDDQGVLPTVRALFWRSNIVLRKQYITFKVLSRSDLLLLKDYKTSDYLSSRKLFERMDHNESTRLLLSNYGIPTEYTSIYKSTLDKNSLLIGSIRGKVKISEADIVEMISRLGNSNNNIIINADISLRSKYHITSVSRGTPKLSVRIFRMRSSDYKYLTEEVPSIYQKNSMLHNIDKIIEDNRKDSLEFVE